MPASAAAGSGYKTVTRPNLRAKASSSGKVLLVMPGGATVKDLGSSKNGFIKVEYQGTAGWAHGAYLAPTNSDLAPPITGEAVTTSSVNLRQGPDTGDAIIQTLKNGTWVETSDTVLDGFRHCRLNGVRGWIYDEFLGSQTAGIQSGQELTTTSAVNMRQKPSTSGRSSGSCRMARPSPRMLRAEMDFARLSGASTAVGSTRTISPDRGGEST
jgi:SH3-like domain-containing protein